MSTKKPLEELSLQQVCNLLPNINFSILIEIVKEKEIDGLALYSVETLDELVETFSSVLSAMKLKALLTKITGFKADGVSSDLLLPQEVKSEIVLAPTSPQLSQNVQLKQTPRYMANDDEGQLAGNFKMPLILLLEPLSKLIITFIEAIEDIISLLSSSSESICGLTVENLQMAADIAIDHGDNWATYNGHTMLSNHEIAAIALYSMETPFFKALNTILRESGRNKAKPFLKYIMLLHRALLKCPKPSVNTVFRGFATNVSSFYEVDKEFNWAQLSSTTINYETARSFLSDDSNKLSTMFHITFNGIDCGRVISMYSTLPDEEEVLIALMSRFRVTRTTIENKVITIYLVAIPPIEDILHMSEQASLSSASLSSASASIRWECTSCTFSNHESLCICEMCGTNVPKLSTGGVGQLIDNAVGIDNAIGINRVKTCEFQTVNDENGVLFHIATNGGIKLYRNPHEAGYVVASRSSDGMFGGGDVKSLVGRTSEINVTADEKDSWMAVDLGAHRSVVVNHFCLRYGWSCTSTGIHFPQNFELQGSNCETTTESTWETIQRHESDTFNYTLACPSPNNFGKKQPWAHWEVAPPNGATIPSFRHFRILQFGAHQGGRHVLALSGLELYGELTEHSS